MILLLLLVPLAVAAGSFIYFRRTITVLEFLLQLGLSVAIAVGGWFLMRANSLKSVEHWNGRITAKNKGTESCCHCHTVCDATDKDGNCTSSHEECDHFNDNWWSLDVSTGDRIRHGCEGRDRPPGWWSKATIGEAASIEHSYTNYLKADPDSLLHHSADPKDLQSLPPFPKVHGKYHVSKVVTHGSARAPRSWQSQLMELNADIGARKQVDITVVLTSRSDPEWAYALEAGWLYGPKNALIVVMGTDGSKINWARVVTISDVEELKIELRDELPGRALTDPDLISDIGRAVQAKFHRKPMADFDYLLSAAAPKGWRLVGLYLLVLLVSLGLTIFMHANDVFGERRSRYSSQIRRRRY